MSTWPVEWQGVLLKELATFLVRVSDQAAAELDLQIREHGSESARVQAIYEGSRHFLEPTWIGRSEYTWARIASNAATILRQGERFDLAYIAQACFRLGSKVTLLNSEIASQLAAGDEAQRQRQKQDEGRRRGHEARRWWMKEGQQYVIGRLVATSGKISLAQLATETHGELSQRFPRQSDASRPGHDGHGKGGRRLPTAPSMQPHIRKWVDDWSASQR